MILSLSPVCIDSSLAGVEMCSCWAYLFDGMGFRALGCAVRIGARMAATCFVTNPPVWRENGLANLDLFHRVYPPR